MSPEADAISYIGRILTKAEKQKPEARVVLAFDGVPPHYKALNEKAERNSSLINVIGCTKTGEIYEWVLIRALRNATILSRECKSYDELTQAVEALPL